jgi:cobyrinic acid a,c-diamide synthase
VHPQFTEPDVALTLAGHPPEHVLLDAAAGFALDPDAVSDDADLVIVGNPTNPSSVLHPASTLRALARPGRLLVVDEAFMDSVPVEHQSLAVARTPGVVVVRSLTKLWSIPGVRAGYVLAEPSVVAELRAQQSPWSVSTTAAAAMIACAGDEAVAESAARAKRLTHYRAVLVDGLTELGIDVVPDPAGPFVLARVGDGVHARLRSAGYAVRRADTFPGLDATWVRIAVRRPDTTRKLLAVLRTEGGAP